MSSKAQNSKTVVLLNQTIATNATTSAMVDRLGFDYGVIDIVMPPATATNSSAKWTVLKLQESDTTAVSDATNISGFIGTTNSTAATTATAAEFVIPANNTTTAGGGTAASGGGQITQLDIDLRGRKRYLFLIAQANASHQTAVATAKLYRGEKIPVSVSERNVAAVAVG
jgi:hypothetical protein